MKEEVLEILEELEALENFYAKDYINLKTYYEIKNNILLKYISIGEAYKSDIEGKFLNNELWRSS